MTADKEKKEKKEKKKAPKTHKVPDAEFQELLKNTEELQKTKETLLRTVAEYENSKKRLEKQKEEFIQYANKKLLSEFLPIIDNLGRAIQSAKGNNSVESLLQGVEMINKLLLDTLKNHGLEKIECLEKPFDPHFHEAIGTVETNDFDEDTVVEEVSPGYKYKELLLKPAMVKVSKKAEEEASKDGE